MPTYYVGPGGNDGNSGLTWALRKLTLNGVEDIPVAAADLVYVGPGCYREMLICDVSGGAGTEIVYAGDVTGEHTDDVGGVVRITGSDDDQTTARDHCIDNAGNRNYRTFRGFFLDTSAAQLIDGGDSDHWVIEDCVTQSEVNSTHIIVNGANQSDWTIRRCICLYRHAYSEFVDFTHSATVDDTGHLVENCLVLGGDRSVNSTRVGGITVRNCTIGWQQFGIRVNIALTVGQTITVNNCIFASCLQRALQGTVAGEIIENFNTFSGNATDRQDVDVGANSQTYPPLFLLPILFSGVSQISGFKFPWWFGALSEWSMVAAITGSNEPTEDLCGILRPATAAKNSWGAMQFSDMEREMGTVHAGSVSMVLHDAGRHQIWVPVASESTTISVYVYREANYAGNNPQMIVKQPGQADDVTTDAAAASQWNELTTTLTPAAEPPYVVVELVSRNTNGANDKVFFDDLTVT